MKRLFIVFIFFIPIILFSQTDSKEINNFSKAYKDLFALDKEIIFLHLNKTSFIPLESLWFTAYVKSTNTNLPSFDTSNLIVSVYDTNNALIERKTIYIENGVGNGHFDLPSDKYKPGSYFIEASTYYSKNFDEPENFIQEFIVLGESNEQQPVKAAYDIQFLPEGGHLISEINNSVGFKLIDQNGKGVSFSKGFLISSKGDTLTNFSSNQFGIGKFQFTPQLNETYHTKVVLPNQDVIESTIDKAELTGMNIIANIFVPNSIVFMVNTNSRTLEEVAKGNYYFLISQGLKSKIIAFNMPVNQLSLSVSIPHKDLFSGINTVTLLNEEFKPVLERLVYVPNATKKIPIKAKLNKNLIDSLNISINTNPISQIHNVSVSILPKETEAYNAQNNIISALMLKPFLKGNIDDPSYYFSESNKKRKQIYNLDLLLMTQGWSKIEWKDLFKKPLPPTFKRRSGFSLSGKLQNKKITKEDKVFIKSYDGLFSILNLNDRGEFEIENQYIEDGTNISIGLLIDKKLYDKPIGSLTMTPLKNLDVNYSVVNHTFKFKSDIENSNYNIPQNFISKVEELDTVTIKAKKEKELKVKGKPFTNYEVVDENMINKYFYVSDYLRTKGYNVSESQGNVHITTRFATSLRGHGHPLITIDGFTYSDNSGASNILYMMRMNQVEYIGINKQGLGLGSRGNAGGIEIKTNTSYREGRAKNKIFSYTTKNGYAAQKEFYNPKYASYTDDIFKHYGTIGWFPLNAFDENGQLLLKVQNTLQKEITLFIEGMTEDGELISEKVNIKI